MVGVEAVTGKIPALSVGKGAYSGTVVGDERASWYRIDSGDTVARKGEIRKISQSIGAPQVNSTSKIFTPNFQG